MGSFFASLTHLWNLNLPDDELGAQRGSVVALVVPVTHSAAAVDRVHTIYIGAYRHTKITIK